MANEDVRQMHAVLQFPTNGQIEIWLLGSNPRWGVEIVNRTSPENQDGDGHYVLDQDEWTDDGHVVL